MTVAEAVAASFPADARPRIVALLSSYGREPYEREAERVQLAIVKLAGGDEAKLAYFLGVAKQDYRDVLFWADNPEQARIDTPEKRKEVREMLKRLGVEPPDGLKD